MKKYDKYKDSGFDWIGEIPEHWNIATIGRISNLGRGRVISSIEINNNAGEYPVYSSQTKNNGVMGYLNTYDFEGKYVTWTTDGANAGTVSYREGKFNCTNVCGTIQPKNWDNIELKFLPYFLNLGTRFSVRLDINPKLMNNMMAKIPIAIPPKNEQTFIANYLDKKTEEIDKLITQKKQLLKLYKEEKKAIINQAVTKGINPDVKLKDSGIEWLGDIPEHWEVKKIKYLGKFINGYSFKSTDFDSNGVKVLKISNIQNMHIDWSDSSYVDEKFYDIHKDFRVFKNDLVFALTRPIISTGIKVALIDTDEKILLNQRNSVYRPSQIQIKWFYYLLLSKNFIQEFDSCIDNTGQQPNISSNDIGEIAIPVPSDSEQYELINFIDKHNNEINLKINKTQKLIDLLTEYRTALISEVVTGKIKVTK